MRSASLARSCKAAFCTSWKIQRILRAGKSRMSSTISIVVHGRVEMNLDEVVWDPWPVEIEGEVVVEQVGRLKDAILEPLLGIAFDKTGDVRHFPLVPRRVT